MTLLLFRMFRPNRKRTAGQSQRVEIGQNASSIARPVFRPIYRICSTWWKRQLWWFSRLSEFESVVKIEMAPFLVALGSIFARNYRNPERLVVRARRRLHPFSRRILQGRELKQKFGKVEIRQNVLTKARPFRWANLSNLLDMRKTRL